MHSAERSVRVARKCRRNIDNDPIFHNQGSHCTWDPLVAGVAVSLQKQPDFEAYVRPAGNLSSATASDLPRPDVVVADYESGMRLITSAQRRAVRW